MDQKTIIKNKIIKNKVGIQNAIAQHIGELCELSESGDDIKARFYKEDGANILRECEWVFSIENYSEVLVMLAKQFKAIVCMYQLKKDGDISETLRASIDCHIAWCQEAIKGNKW